MRAHTQKNLHFQLCGEKMLCTLHMQIYIDANKRVSVFLCQNSCATFESLVLTAKATRHPAHVRDLLSSIRECVSIRRITVTTSDRVEAVCWVQVPTAWA